MDSRAAYAKLGVKVAVKVGGRNGVVERQRRVVLAAALWIAERLVRALNLFEELVAHRRVLVRVVLEHHFPVRLFDVGRRRLLAQRAQTKQFVRIVARAQLALLAPRLGLGLGLGLDTSLRRRSTIDD